jgi:hypothetical protein
MTGRCSPLRPRSVPTSWLRVWPEVKWKVMGYARFLPAVFRHVIALGWAALALCAQGQAVASDVSWNGPAECAERDQLLFEVERAIGRPLTDTAPLEFSIRVERSSRSFTAWLSSTDRNTGERTRERVLAAADCARLVDTLAVAISLAIGASAGPEPMPAPARAEAIERPAPRRAATRSAPIDDAGQRPPETSVGPAPRAVVWLVSDVGSMPAPALGAALGLELAWPRLQLLVLGTLFLAQNAQLERDPTVGAEVNFAVVTALACTKPWQNAANGLSASLCAGGDAGRLAAVGRGVSAPREAEMLWLAPHIDAGLFWKIPDVDLRLGALLTAGLPLDRDEFILDELGTVHRPARAVGRASLGLEVGFE